MGGGKEMESPGTKREYTPPGLWRGSRRLRAPRLSIIEASRQSCRTLRAGIESACPIGRRQNQFVPGQVNLGKLDGRISIDKSRQWLHVALTTQQPSRKLFRGFPCLLDGSGGEYSRRPLVEHDAQCR